MKILITGATSNIGLETGIKLLELGHFVYFTTHHEYELKNLSEKLKKYKNASCFKLDITKEEDRKKILEYDIDCLINNASIGKGGSIIELDIRKIKENFEVNVFGTLRLSQIYAGDLFVKKRKGKIIFISSISGIVPVSFLGSYCMSKACIITMSETLRKELKLITKDIQVKLIEPGIYNTGFNDLMFEDKLSFKSKYFKDLESITLKQKKLFKLLGKDDLESVTTKIVKACLDTSNKFLYKAPFSQAILTKMYMLLFK